MYRRILVPLDGSQLAEQALPYVRLLGRRLNLPVHLLRSYDVSPLDMGVLVSSGYLEEYLASLQAESGEYLSPVAEGLMQDGLTVTTGVLQGAAAPAIVAKTDNVPGNPGGHDHSRSVRADSDGSRKRR